MEDSIEKTPDPFFIIGCGRSGTTLARVMLNNHPKVAVPLESLFIVDYLRTRRSIPATRLREWMLNEYEVQEWGVPIAKEQLDGCDTPREMIDRLHQIYAQQNGKQRWGQKTPRFIRHGDLFKSVYPGAKFVHIVRDPRAVASSLARSDVHASNVYFASRRWERDVNAGLRLEEKYPRDVLRVSYESLVTEPKDTFKQVCDFLEIDFDEEILNYHQSESKEYGTYYNNIHARLSKPPDPKRIEAWKTDLTPKQITVIESICGPTMDRLGYPRISNEATPEGGYIMRLKAQRIFGLGKQIYHTLSTRHRYLWGFLKRKFKLGLQGDLLDVNY